MRLVIWFSLLFLASIFDAASAMASKHRPAWPDDDFPPLVSANRLFRAVHRTCPQQGWNEHLLSHIERAPGTI